LASIDYAIVLGYFVFLIVAGLVKRSGDDTSAESFIVGSRRLTLPAFVASLVSTWYGGILGVGEYSYLYGLSNWLVFGVPYYLAALIFAFFIAERARKSEVLTIPDQLNIAYGKPSASVGSVILFIMAVPAAYVLMAGAIVEVIFGLPLWVGVIAGTVFSLVYVHFGGFNSVIRTDILQFGLMFVGFGVILATAYVGYGGFDFLVESLPDSHFTWHGGNSGWYIAVWYVIALQTLIEPTFYQRCYAVKKTSDARKGIFISILFWFVFDAMTTTTGLYARAILPDLSNPVTSYPALAELILPIGLLGLFMTSLMATVMSTIDSYAFVAASTYGRDIVWRMFGVPENRITLHTRIGLLLTGVLAVAIALFLGSVIDIWHHFGSVGTPALLVPLLSAHIGKRRMSPSVTFVSMLLSGGISLIWLLSSYISADSSYWLGIQPIFPGLAVSVLFYLLCAKDTAKVSNIN